MLVKSETLSMVAALKSIVESYPAEMYALELDPEEIKDILVKIANWAINYEEEI